MTARIIKFPNQLIDAISETIRRGPGNYILDGHRPVRCDDLMLWGAWFQEHDRRVASTRIHGVWVSTVFLGLDHNFGRGPPVLFETMVFGGEMDQEMRRYRTWDEAERGHREMCALVRRAKRKPSANVVRLKSRVEWERVTAELKASKLKQ